MMTPIPPAPFPRKGETASELRSNLTETLPPWGGPAEAA
jgi:hypothetical protein